MRILIIEDEIIIARFIEQQLHLSFDCETGIALDPEEAKDWMPALQPHLVLCDIQLEKEQSGIELIVELQRRYIFEVIFITSYHSRAVIEQAVATKPANYIIKPVDEARLFAGIKLVADKIMEHVAAEKTAMKLKELLNPAELAVLRYVGQRKTTAEIASYLYLSPYTVKNHRHNICAKLNLKDENNALLKWALEHREMIL